MSRIAAVIISIHLETSLTPRLTFPTPLLLHTVFRDQLLKFLETVSHDDFDGYVAALDKAGNTLEYRKYCDQLFEILICGGLLAPGGSYLDEDAPLSPFSIFGAKSTEIKDVRPYVETIEKVIRREWKSAQVTSLAKRQTDTFGYLVRLQISSEASRGVEPVCNHSVSASFPRGPAQEARCRNGSHDQHVACFHQRSSDAAKGASHQGWCVFLFHSVSSLLLMRPMY